MTQTNRLSRVLRFEPDPESIIHKLVSLGKASKTFTCLGSIYETRKEILMVITNIFKIYEAISLILECERYEFKFYGTRNKILRIVKYQGKHVKTLCNILVTRNRFIKLQILYFYQLQSIGKNFFFCLFNHFILLDRFLVCSQRY